ncbi:MAG: ESPR domain-containing protein, partial [Neisseriaceae bacterium]|nr:ESPR domain-containing protein [Neisseriaceae bacterium]
MNKVYRVIYNKSTNQTMVVSEITKSHTKSGSSLTDKRQENVSGNLKVRPLTAIVAAVAMMSPFMANQAQADVLCKYNNQVIARTGNSCPSGETAVSTISWSGGTANGTNTTAWGSGYAGAAQSTDTVNYTISSNNYPADENGNRPIFTITKTVTGN